MNRKQTFIFAYLIVSSLFLFSNSVLAQADPLPKKIVKESYRGMFGFSAGPSFPFGSFQQKDLVLLEGGYAQSGLALNFDLGYRFNENFILVAQYIVNTNPFDDDALLKNGSSICPTCSPPLNFTSAEAGDYQLNSFLIGYGFIKELPDYSFQLQLMIGTANMSSPQITLDHSNGVLTVNSNTERDLVYSLGSVFRVRLNEEIDFTTSGNFIVFQSNFDQGFNTPGASSSAQSTLRYQVFNLTLGLSFRILKKEDEPKDQLRY